jgi:hypothetical protein
MLLRGDHERRPNLRWAVVGLVVAASTVAAGIADFSGSLDLVKVALFVLAGLLAAAVALLTDTGVTPTRPAADTPQLTDLKKNV